METFLNQRISKEFNNGINLKEFTDEELSLFMEIEEGCHNNENSHQNDEFYKNRKRGSTDSGKINSFFFDRTKFILKIVRLCKEKLTNFKETSLVKALEWLTREIQESILFKSDELSIKKLEKLKKENKDLQTVFSWLEEYSTIKTKQKNSLLRDSKKNTNGHIKHNGDDNNISKNHSVSFENSYHNAADSFFDEDSDSELISDDHHFINFSEDSIASIEKPTFDIFKLESEVGEDNTLSTISCYIFTTMGFYSMIKYEKFEKFIQAIANGYKRENPYHNDLHAADVLQTTSIFLKWGNIKEKLGLSELDICALLISALIHDFKHPGVTNLFLVNTGHPIAVKYNDDSVLENYHIAESFKLIRSKEEYNIFSEISKNDYKIMRKRMIESVLATDMKFHAKQFSYLKLQIATYSIKNGENIEKIFEGLDNLALYQTQQDFLNIIIHSCDISNPTKPFHIYKNWAVRVMEEFWRQGDKERELDLPISFLCDRKTNAISASQIGFMNGIVGPFFSELLQFFPSLSFLLDNVNNNKEHFKKLKEEEEK